MVWSRFVSSRFKSFYMYAIFYLCYFFTFVRHLYWASTLLTRIFLPILCLFICMLFFFTFVRHLYWAVTLLTGIFLQSAFFSDGLHIPWFSFRLHRLRRFSQGPNIEIGLVTQKKYHLAFKNQITQI